MRTMMRLYRFFNLMSIDVAVGAMVSSAFFARIFQIQMRTDSLATLGLSVWIIYSVDHLLDAYKLKKDASTKRHLFHQQHFRVISIVVIAAVIIDLILIRDVGKPVIFFGTVLIFAIVFYLLFQRWLGPFKELIGAALYSFGVLLPGLSLLTAPATTSLVFIIVAFFLTALINLVLLAWFDLEHDLRDGHTSAAIFFGKHKSNVLLTVLFVFQTILFVGLLLLAPYKSEVLILIAMNMILLLIFYFYRGFDKEDFYRLASEIIFLVPLPYLLLYE